MVDLQGQSLGIELATGSQLQAEIGVLGSWDRDDSQKMQVRFSTLAEMVPLVPVVDPPDDNVFVHRRSDIYPDPTLDFRGRPINWVPTGMNEYQWGRLRVLFGNEDVSYYRGIPVQVKSWSINEPFGYATAVIAFPQISPFEPLPGWLANWVNVDIRLVDPDGDEKTLWVGMFADEEDSLTDSGSGLEVQLIGALYQADLYVMPPAITPKESEDIGKIIVRELNPLRRPNLRTLSVIGFPSTGIEVKSGGAWDQLLTGYIQGLLEQSTISDETGQRQFTINMDGRRPTFTLKEREVVSWTMRCGQPGITHQLSRDLSMVPTTIYGEGVDSEHCHWRNTKYPNLRTDDAPVFPGTVMNPGDSSPDIEVWQREMYNNGWTSIVVDEDYTTAEEGQVRTFQGQAGITVDGAVGPQTWAAIFQPGSNSGDLRGAWFMPLFTEPYVEPQVFNPSGGLIGPNPIYQSDRIKVEKYENFGSPITKDEAVRSCVAEVDRDGVVDVHTAGYYGTLSLNTDPNEGSRFEIQAGQNFLLQSHRGDDRLFHIASVDVNWEGQSVELTVDERARDYATLAATMVRDRENHDPAKRKKTQYRNSKQIEDRWAEWDCENGAGVIPRHGIYAGLWNVLRIPAGEVGTIVKSEFTVDTPANFSVAVFDRAITANVLSSHGIPTAAGYWDSFPEEEGLIIAWGGEGQMGGYYPGAESDDTPVLTGRLVDDASWYYRTLFPPWLWMAFWCESPAINYIQGRLFPGIND